MNQVFERQLRRAGINLDVLPQDIKGFLGVVERMYDGFEKDRSLLERSLEISSKELIEHNQELEERTRQVQYEKNRLQVTLASIGDGAFSVDRSGKIVFFNKIAQEISGFTAQEAIGKWYRDILRFVLEKDGSKNFKFIEDSLERGLVSHLSNHTFLLTKDDRKIPVEDSAAPLKDENGIVIGAIVIFRDVTEARDLERTKANFISIASHQLRTPLTVLRWTSEMFLNGDLGTLTEEQKSFLGDMHKSSLKLLDLINVFLASSRIEEGRVDIKPVSTDIVAITKEVVSSVAPLIKMKKLDVMIMEGPLPKINLELEMFRQVVLNLVSNALNYTPGGGKIIVRFELKPPVVVWTIKDTGIGIPKQNQPKIFEKFFRADNAMKEVTDGSGLGLNLAKSIVESWGGKIWFESEEGKGTTFSFTVPLVGMKPHKGEVKINT